MKIWDIIFELIKIEVQCSKNYFNSFLQQEAEAIGNNIEKEPQKEVKFNASGKFFPEMY